MRLFKLRLAINWKRTAFIYGVRLPIVLALAGTSFLYFKQDALLFQGSSRTDAPSEVIKLPVILKSAAGQPMAWVAEPPSASATVVLFHGNGSYAQDLFEMKGPFLDRNIRIVFIEYPGYGSRKGPSPSKDLVVKDAVTALREVSRLYPNQPLWLAGESLGAGVAAQVAQSNAELIEKVLLFVPWNKLSDVAKKRFPVFPMKGLLKADWDSCSALKGLADRTTVVVAANDRIIPPSEGLSLATCLGLSGQRVIKLEDSGHNDWYFSLRSKPDIWDSLLASE